MLWPIFEQTKLHWQCFVVARINVCVDAAHIRLNRHARLAVERRRLAPCDAAEAEHPQKAIDLQGDRAKDLGVVNIANSAPQVLGPALSAPIVVHLGGYPTLYAATAVVTVLGSVLVLKIRSVP